MVCSILLALLKNLGLVADLTEQMLSYLFYTVLIIFYTRIPQCVIRLDDEVCFHCTTAMGIPCATIIGVLTRLSIFCQALATLPELSKTKNTFSFGFLLDASCDTRCQVR